MHGMGVSPWIGVLVVAWLGLAVFSWWLMRVRPRGEDIPSAAFYRLIQVYSRLFHRLTVEGQEHIPARGWDQEGCGPLIVVANHTAGVDPVLIQSVIPFEVRWMMGEDMRLPGLDRLWAFVGVIFVDRHSSRSVGVRDALRHLKAGGTLGVFAEGHIERPPRRVLPFQSGVGLMVRRSGANVLPVIVDGTPQVDPAWASLWRRSRASVRFLPVRSYEGTDLDAAGIASDLRSLYLEATGWRASDFSPRLVEGRWVAGGESPVPDPEESPSTE